MTKIGVLDLETFFPARERFELVMTVNGLLASPSFNLWSTGEPLDIDHFLYTRSGKPKVSIFYIAHLTDPERMFFVSTLLNQIVSGIRSQAGTTSLRALVYMDEIFGYFPPVANPPSKLPMLTLLKQARAFGVGILLATQNPVDLDYRGLSNTGTWFIGRLQTERDKEKLLDGLEGVADSSGNSFDRKSVDRIISDLSQRVFLLNNTHEDEPEVFHTRWVMSYMHGPMTREQIKTLMSEKKADSPAAPSPRPVNNMTPEVSSRPSLPPGISQYFVPIQSNANGRQLLYRPAVIGYAKIAYLERKLKIDTSVGVTAFSWVTDDVIPVNWERSEEYGFPITTLEKSSQESGQFTELPSSAVVLKSYSDWEKDFVIWLVSNRVMTLFKSEAGGTISKPLESERDFRIRMKQENRERRDDEVEKVRSKYAPRIAALQERIRRAQQSVEREWEQASAEKRQAAISFGTTLLTAFLGRKAVSRSSMSRASTAMRGVGRSMQAGKDVERVNENVEALQGQLDALEIELRDQVSSMELRVDPLTENLEVVRISASRSAVSTRLFGLGWVPFWKESGSIITPAWK